MSKAIAEKKTGRVVTPYTSFRKQIPEPLLKELQAMGQPDNWHNILYIGLDWVIIVGVVLINLLIGFHWPTYILAVLIIGTRQRGLMNLLHQASQSRLFRHAGINIWLGRLCIGFPLMTSLSAYTASHRMHHAYLWDRDLDPKSMRYDELGLLEPPRDIPNFVFHHVIAPLLLLHVPQNLANALRWQNEECIETLSRYGFLVVIIVLSAILHILPMLFFFWIVPYCTTFQIIRYITDMIDHAGLESRDPWLSTRTWEGPWIWRLILAPHSDNYHLAHHLFPLIPHYRFARAHRLLTQVPAYGNAHHCKNIFWSQDEHYPSVMQDILALDRSPLRGKGVKAGTVDL